MKLYKLCMLLAIVTGFVWAGCSKNSDKPDGNTTQKQYPEPGWHVDDAASLAYSMTAVIAISDSLKQTVNSGDEVAAFVGNECRGVGVYVARDSASPVFFVLIKGAANESDSLNFKYYNKQNQYMYSTGNILDFKIDDNYGTVDDPALPEFTPM